MAVLHRRRPATLTRTGGANDDKLADAGASATAAGGAGLAGGKEPTLTDCEIVSVGALGAGAAALTGSAAAGLGRWVTTRSAMPSKQPANSQIERRHDRATDRFQRVAHLRVVRLHVLLDHDLRHLRR